MADFTPSDSGHKLTIGPGPPPLGKEKEYETTFTIMPDEQFYQDIMAVFEKHGLIHPKSYHFILSRAGKNLHLVDHYKLAPGEKPVDAALEPSGHVIADQYETEQVTYDTSKAPPGADTAPESLEQFDTPPPFTPGSSGGRFSLQ
jgi:hypothetical protein